ATSSSIGRLTKEGAHFRVPRGIHIPDHTRGVLEEENLLRTAAGSRRPRGDLVESSGGVSVLPPMARTTSPISSTSALLILVLLSFATAKSPHPITDAEIRAKKNACYADIERSGLWGWQCRSSLVTKENCALRCLSPACYELIYESDPLEEGEIDYIRSQEYKYCMHKLSIGESLNGVKGSFNY
ncbi:hypothetical protein Taro_005510, partial [Colocasia esculenta]|nr:hypothetical protein [Colocasia esculenta]